VVGSSGLQSTVRGLDVREGGRFNVVMHGPDGTDYDNLNLFDHVEESRQLIHTNVGSERFGLAPFQSVVDLESVGDKTRVVLQARFTSEEDMRKHVQDFHAIDGARELLERLEEPAT
jgi:hypothetical protein